MATETLHQNNPTDLAPVAPVRGKSVLLSLLDGPPLEPARRARAERRRRYPRRTGTGNRQRYMQEIASTTDLAESCRVHRKLNRNVLIATTTLGLTTGGALLWAPLSYLGAVGIVLVSRHTVMDAVAQWREQRRIGVAAMSALVKILLLANFQFVLCSLSVMLYASNRKLMHTVRDHSTRNMIDVFRQTPREVWVMRNEVELQVPLDSVTTDDVVVVHAGEMIPVDGRIVHGSGAVDQHMLNGESQPADKHPGDEVLALTVVLSGRLYIQTERTGEQTAAAQVAHILEKTVGMKTDTQLWVESLADRTVLPTCLLGLAALPWVGPLNAIALLYSHPNYKITLAGSVSMLNGLNIAAHHGILIKDSQSLELLERVDTVVFDKTGTLTSPEPQVGEIHCMARGWNQNRVLRMAAAAEYKQSHPIALAILAEAGRRDLNIPSVTHTDYHLGQGLLVMVAGHEVRVGSASFIQQCELALPVTLQEIQQCCHAQGHSLVLVAVDRQVVGAIELHASIRPEARTVIQRLRQRGVSEIIILSGDHDIPTRVLAGELGVDRYVAQILPEQKADHIAELQRQGKTVCYVGDGINDAIALKQADVSVSLRGAASVAMDTAGVVLMDANLNHLGALFDLARGVQRNIRRTFLIVLLPHALSAVGAALVLYHGMVPTMVLTMGGLLVGIYNGARRFIRLEPSADAQPDAETPHQVIPLLATDQTTQAPSPPGQADDMILDKVS